MALIFEKTSTRTRCAFEVAAHDLGLGTTYLDPSGSQIGKKESIADTARVLGRMYRRNRIPRFPGRILWKSWHNMQVPVWNGLTNEFHPTQMLADLLTIREHLGRIQGVKLVAIWGDARYNMGNSYMVACAKMGMHSPPARLRNTSLTVNWQSSAGLSRPRPEEASRSRRMPRKERRMRM